MSKKGILEFDLTDPDAKADFELAVKAIDYKLALWDFSMDVLRQMTKYGTLDGRELNKVEQQLAQEISDKFYAIINDRDVKID